MIYFFLFISGACLGSFLTVVAERLPLGLSFVSPSSHCTTCQHGLAIKDLIPIYSYVQLKGKCRYCGAAFSPLSTVAELLVGSFVCLLYCLEAWHIYFSPLLLLMISAGLLSLTDYLYRLVAPQIFYFFCLLTTVTIIFLPTILSLHIIDALIVYCFLRLLSKLISDGLGGGDLKLLTSWAFFLGIQAVALITLSACCLALLFYLFSNKKHQKIPFVPYLSVGLLLYLFSYLI